MDSVKKYNIITLCGSIKFKDEGRAEDTRI